MCADSQETVEDEKQYSEKIAIIEDQTYPLAVGGAGITEIIEAFAQEICEQISQSKPKTKKELKSLVKTSILKVYQEDVPVAVISKQHRTQEFLVAAKPLEEPFVILRLRGKRVYEVKEKAIIGYATTLNNRLLERMFHSNLSMQKAVMLAVFLVSQSKAIDLGVGGQTKVAVVVENGAWFDDDVYIQDSEKRVEQFLALSDSLFLDSVDISIPPSELKTKLDEFQKKINELRDSHTKYTFLRTMDRMSNDPNYKGDPYWKVFPGAEVAVSTTAPFLQVKEQTPEEREQIRKLMKLAESNPENRRGYKLPGLLEGRKILYIGNETTTLYPKPAGSTG
jgi:hypothetical protein